MKRLHGVLAALLCAAAARAQQPLVIENVAVVDATTPSPRRGQTVVVADGRIRAVGPAGRVAIPRGARRVDGTGRYLIPGLWDMHVHLASAGESALPMLVAMGITSVRDMGGGLDTLRGWQARVRAGTLVGPRIRLAGPIVEEGRWLDRVRRIPAVQRVFADDPRIGVTTPAEARRAVDSLAALLVDLIKVRNAPPRDAYLALMDQARRRGLAVAGHTPRGEIGLRGAVAAGQRSIEHIDVLPDELDSLTAPARAALFGEMKRAGTWYTPTVVSVLPLTLERGVVAAVVEDTLGVLDPRRAYLSARTLGFWRLQQQLDEYEDPKDWDALLARGIGYVGEMHRAGVPLLAGTDMGVRLVYPGFSLHDELARLVDRVGLSPREALGTATLQPARFFGEEAEGGTVAAGKRADLVLLDADPLADIRNTQRIRAVVRDGRLLSRGELDEILARARGTAAPRGPFTTPEGGGEAPLRHQR